MARKQLEQLLAEAAALAERLADNETTSSPHEVDELLKEMGYEPDDLRRQLHEGVKGIAARMERAGEQPPQYLMQIIGATAPFGELAAKSNKAALDRIRESFRALVSAAAADTVFSSEALATSRAYRKTSRISDQDSQLLDRLEAELKSRAANNKRG